MRPPPPPNQVSGQACLQRRSKPVPARSEAGDPSTTADNDMTGRQTTFCTALVQPEGGSCLSTNQLWSLLAGSDRFDGVFCKAHRTSACMLLMEPTVGGKDRTKFSNAVVLLAKSTTTLPTTPSGRWAPNTEAPPSDGLDACNTIRPNIRGRQPSRELWFQGALGPQLRRSVRECGVGVVARQ